VGLTSAVLACKRSSDGQGVESVDEGVRVARALCRPAAETEARGGETGGRDDKSVPLVIRYGERNSAHDVSLHGLGLWAGLVACWAGWVGLAQFPSLLFPFLFLFLFVLCYTSFMYINQSGIFLLWYNVPW